MMQNLLPALPKTIVAFLLFIAMQTTAQPLSRGTHQKNVPKGANQATGKNQLRYVIINNGKTGFGYDILDQNRIIIHQPSVPGLPGNKGFSTILLFPQSRLFGTMYFQRDCTPRNL